MAVQTQYTQNRTVIGGPYKNAKRGNILESVRKNVINRAGGRCENDGKTFYPFLEGLPCPAWTRGDGSITNGTLDHKIPLKCGGNGSTDNVARLCDVCYRNKQIRESNFYGHEVSVKKYHCKCPVCTAHLNELQQNVLARSPDTVMTPIEWWRHSP